jgi:chaperone BCS1
MDKRTKDELVSDIDRYLKPSTRRFYTDRGIPYRRGYLLHGPPGTGKTSLSLALAGRFGLELYILHLPSLTEDGELQRLFTSLPPQCIVLLEDIDAVGTKRQQLAEEETKSPDNKLISRRGTANCTLSGLLNVLDGVTSQEGRIVFMTSNMADKLDDALVRPGRIDKMIFMGNIGGEAAEEMFLRMYAPEPKDTSNAGEIYADGIGEAELKNLAADFRVKIPDDVFTPAQLQGYLLIHRGHPEVAVADVGKWIETETTIMEEAKEQEIALDKLRAKLSANQKAKLVTNATGTSLGLSTNMPPLGVHPGDVPGISVSEDAALPMK